MKGQIKLLAAATMLAAGSANAAIDQSTTGNGELFFTIWDKVSQVAYTKDLGFNLDDFLVGGFNATHDQNFNLAGDANWNTFLSNSTAANTVWMIGAMDETGAGSGGARYLTTSKVSITTVKTQSNSNLIQYKNSNGFLQSNNSFGTHQSQADGSAYTTIADSNAYPQGGLQNLENWNTKAPYATTAAANEALSFFYLTPSSSAGLSKATVNQFMKDNGTEGATWSVNLATNELDYKVVTPIPAAAWLLGSALLGLVGVGRRNTKSNVAAA